MVLAVSSPLRNFLGWQALKAGIWGKQVLACACETWIHLPQHKAGNQSYQFVLKSLVNCGVCCLFASPFSPLKKKLALN